MFFGAGYCGLSWLYVLLSSLPTSTPSYPLLTCFPLNAIHILTILLHSFPFFRRSDIRTLYDIRGNVMGDCLRACFCMPCTLIQNEKEVLYRQSLQNTDKGYQAVPGMTAAPQQ
jgi:Cys-rich protein (TIGR01571 family)